MGRAKTTERQLCEQLFINENLTAEEVAKRAGVSARQVGKWRAADNWDLRRKSLLTTKASQLQTLYDSLENLQNSIKKRDEDQRFPTPKEADTISKLTSSIKRLETETSLAQIMEVGKLFIEFIRLVDMNKAIEIIALYDAFIKSSIK